MDIHLHGWRDLKEEFELRLRVLLANLKNRDHFSANTLNIGVPRDHRVNLAEFSEWAKSEVQWNIPKELAELAKPRNKPDPGEKVQDAPSSAIAKERNTLLIIIAALCKKSEIDLEARGTASLIAKLTEAVGAAVSDDTVRGVLKKIPEAVERRGK
jgi:hypothetical protein